MSSKVARKHMLSLEEGANGMPDLFFDCEFLKDFPKEISLKEALNQTLNVKARLAAIWWQCCGLP